MRNTVILFARAPRLGMVKRRLAADIGHRAAYRFHAQSLFLRIRQLARDRRFRRVLAITPDTARLRLPGSIARIGQGRGDLGVRMSRAFRRFRRDRVVLVGCDIPDMTIADLGQAFRELGSADAVFGPALDGGYWLVGLSPNRPANPFRKVSWSTNHALQDTLLNFRGRTIRQLRVLRDIDTGSDHALWRETKRDGSQKPMNVEPV